jgi:hypothetical protein
MDEVTRRQAVGVAALAGVIAAAGLTPGAAADDKTPKGDGEGKANPEFDEKAERQHVITCGMTEAEADCWVLVARAAGKFFELPKLHTMDDHEVAHAIHIIQHKLLSRPVYRRYKEVAKGEKK